MKDLRNNKRILPKKSRLNLESHYLEVLRDPWYKALADVQNLINFYTVKFYAKKKIKTLHLPITTGAVSSPSGLGSDSSPVKINLFGVDIYLADSMQFMLEYGCRLFKNGCYYIMPSFRGENADERHLCQFYHSEAEIPGTLEDVIRLVEEYIKYLSRNILNDYADELMKVNGSNVHIESLVAYNGPLPRITFDQAVKLLGDNPKYIDKHEAGFKIINRYGEKELISIFNGFVWLTNFDYLAVPFYQAFHDKDINKTLNADLLFGIGEIVGSGERHKNGDDVRRELESHGVNAQNYNWYIKMKEEFPMKTSGFGLGIERFILWLFKHDDIRDCQILPRFNGVDVIP